MHDDAALLRAAAAGSDRAFARLVDRHQAAVRAFLRRLCRSWADADDLAQETFVTAWSRIASADPAREVRPWLCGIAYRKWMSEGRADVRRRVREAAADWTDEAPSRPDAALDAAAALAILPEEQRAAVALCLAGGFSHAEAAAALDLPLGTVKSHVARGRVRLLEFMGEAR